MEWATMKETPIHAPRLLQLARKKKKKDKKQNIGRSRGIKGCNSET